MTQAAGDGGRGTRDGYHHGNLREALVAAALRLIGERGPAGFAFAEVARAAGVSAAAPYRHFRDRNALVTEVARRGFERLAEMLALGWNEGRPSPAAAMEACGRAYLAFAREEPAAYAAMFEAGLPSERDPGLLAASERAFAVLRRAAELLCGAARVPAGGARPPALMVALHVWSLAHGIAALFVAHDGGTEPAAWGSRSDKGTRPHRRLPMRPEELLEAGLLIYLRSLGLEG